VLNKNAKKDPEKSFKVKIIHIFCENLFIVKDFGDDKLRDAGW
jgi:hypothetical protein